jgi:hypothetical protein
MARYIVSTEERMLAGNLQLQGAGVLRRLLPGVEEFCYRVFFRIVAQADEVQVILRNILKASDHPQLLLAIIVGQQAGSHKKPSCPVSTKPKTRS